MKKLNKPDEQSEPVVTPFFENEKDEAAKEEMNKKSENETPVSKESELNLNEQNIGAGPTTEDLLDAMIFDILS